MRHVAVRRAAVLAGAACLGWVALFAFLVADDPAVAVEPSAVSSAPAPGAVTPPAVTLDGGDALYARHCASCHDADDLRASAGRPLDAAGRASLEAFLAGHGGATADENRRIVEFLASTDPDGPAGR
jgi:hypothetical protein